MGFFVNMIPCKKKDANGDSYWTVISFTDKPGVREVMWTLFLMIGIISGFAYGFYFWGSPVLPIVLGGCALLTVAGNACLARTDNYNHLVFWSSDSEPAGQTKAKTALLSNERSGPSDAILLPV